MPDPVQIAVTVNGRAYRRDVEPRVHLADFLRHELGLTGTHVGCEQGVCGMCTVLVDGEAVKSCLMFAAAGSTGTRSRPSSRSPTATDLHPLQQAFKETHALQCGFCTPGFLMTATALAARRRPARAATSCARSSPACSAAARATRTSSPRSSATSTSARRRARSMAEVSEATARGDALRRDRRRASTRKEDDRLLRGDGRFADDVDPAHGAAHGGRPLPVPARPDPRASTSSRRVALDGVERRPRRGATWSSAREPISASCGPCPARRRSQFYALATDVAAFEGQPVVSVAAVSRHVAEDAVELIDVDYDPLPHVSDVESRAGARRPRAAPATCCRPTCWRSTRRAAAIPRRGSRPRTSSSRSASTSTASPACRWRRARSSREWQPGARELTVRHSTQAPHLVRKQLAESLRLDEGAVRVAAPATSAAASG